MESQPHLPGVNELTYGIVFQEAELEERRQEEEMQRFRQQIIEEERQRLLREHATKLLGYLPKVSQ